jgi:hypothetical protein
MLEFDSMQLSAISHDQIRSQILWKAQTRFPEICENYTTDDLKAEIDDACTHGEQRGVSTVKGYHQYALLCLATRSRLESPEQTLFLDNPAGAIDQKLNILVQMMSAQNRRSNRQKSLEK